ncbi:hypothetical protein K503DRAFT_805048 [Rhizopogon vinicolor AM-OR11-026]|uniref:Uncharacterized protein n=1 Tax=Rhizopogon vinicolor AM-OR11-026 TaxID=1314800 RepID=A0A1B7MJ68_9AGAM|nr:hypothetical protein K503DRAFT_805048 [Rhizopogon vinicolor AM-OR11-026]
MDFFETQPSPPQECINSSLTIPVASTNDFAYEQFGGGGRYESPAVELTPSRLRSRLKATSRNVGLVKDASVRRQAFQPPTTDSRNFVIPPHSQAHATSLNTTLDDDVPPSDTSSLTIPPDSSRHTSPLTVNMDRSRKCT